MIKIISQIINSLNNKIEQNTININKDEFIKIKKLDFKNKIVFIDGGNTEILKSSDFSLQLIRVVGIISKHNRTIKSIKNEFFALAYSEAKMDDIVYKTEIFQTKGDKLIDENNLNFDSFDETIKEGINRGEISKIGDIARRFAELSLASKIAKELEKEDILILDGSLRINYKNENKYINQLKNKSCFICALAKTSQIFNSNAGSLVGDLGIISNKFEYPWYSKVEEGKYAIRLNKSSNYIFEFEVFDDSKISKILSCIINNCNDAIFPGYPYGLILADKIARISNKEKEYLFNVLKAKAGKKWIFIEKYLNSKNAHDILDKIGFKTYLTI